MTATDVVAVLLDLVDSREIPAREDAQERIEQGFAAVADDVSALEALHPTVGDEFQAIHPDLQSALAATLRARLSLPPGVDCRVGLGRGEVRAVGAGVAGELQDGSAWWRARSAIDQAHALEDGAVPTARGWFDAGPDARAEQAAVNAYLLARDALVGAMSDRDRRLVLGTMRGRSQRELAEEESISQSAVSQALRRSAAGALLHGARQLEEAGAAC